MNARDKELAMQAGFNPFDTECYEGLDVLIDLIRADTMEAAKIALLGADKALSDRVVKAIRARGNT